MAGNTVYDFTLATSCDVDETLSITPQQTLIERGAKNQKIHIADDGTEERVNKSSDTQFYFVLRWNRLTAEDAGTIWDIWCDPTKANGSLNSFKWQHPTDGHVYVVRFQGDIERTLQRAQIFSFASITLKVLGWDS